MNRRLRPTGGCIAEMQDGRYVIVWDIYFDLDTRKEVLLPHGEKP